MLVKDLEEKYLGEWSRKGLTDKFARMIAHGMTEEEAIAYVKSKGSLIRDYHDSESFEDTILGVIEGLKRIDQEEKQLSGEA